MKEKKNFLLKDFCTIFMVVFLIMLIILLPELLDTYKPVNIVFQVDPLLILAVISGKQKKNLVNTMFNDF